MSTCPWVFFLKADNFFSSFPSCYFKSFIPQNSQDCFKKTRLSQRLRNKVESWFLFILTVMTSCSAAKDFAGENELSVAETHFGFIQQGLPGRNSVWAWCPPSCQVMHTHGLVLRGYPVFEFWWSWGWWAEFCNFYLKMYFIHPYLVSASKALLCKPWCNVCICHYTLWGLDFFASFLSATVSLAHHNEWLKRCLEKISRNCV